MQQMVPCWRQDHGKHVVGSEQYHLCISTRGRIHDKPNVGAPSLSSSTSSLKGRKGYELKKMDTEQLTATLLSQYEGESEEMVYDSICCASFAHEDMLRGSRGDLPRDPYINHPLRNAIRIQRWGISDRDVIIATVLHDTVEDAPEEILDYCGWMNDDPDGSRSEALRCIGSRYGDRTSDIVAAVTNPTMANGISNEEKVSIYVQHVASVVHDDDVLAVKGSDWVENAGSLHLMPRNTDELRARRIKTRSKYLQVAEHLQSALNGSSYPASVKREMSVSMDKTYRVLSEFQF